MNHIHRIRHLASFLAAFACAMLGLVVSAPQAFALRVDPNLGGSSGAASAGPSPTIIHSAGASGMPGWQIAVIVAVVAVLAAAIAIAGDRARAAHRNVTVPAT